MSYIGMSQSGELLMAASADMAKPTLKQKAGEAGMWYVIQTMTGKEEELVRMIKGIVPAELYSDCFVTYYERIWRRQQKNIVHVERLFPGYVFIISDQPEALFYHLKKVPVMSKLLAGESYTFLALEKDEAIYMKKLLGRRENNTVRLSYIESDGKGQVSYVSGPLKFYLDKVIRFNFKKRYAIINLELLGRDRSIVLGIILKEDIQQEIACEKPEKYLKAPEGSEVPEALQKDIGLNKGDRVKVIAGPFIDMIGSVFEVKKTVVEIEIQMFGQNIRMQLPQEDIFRLEEEH